MQFAKLLIDTKSSFCILIKFCCCDALEDKKYLLICLNLSDRKIIKF